MATLTAEVQFNLNGSFGDASDAIDVSSISILSIYCELVSGTWNTAIVRLQGSTDGDDFVTLTADLSSGALVRAVDVRALSHIRFISIGLEASHGYANFKIFGDDFDPGESIPLIAEDVPPPNRVRPIIGRMETGHVGAAWFADNHTMVANRLYYFPYWIGWPMTFDEASIYIVSSGGTLGRFGIYNSDTDGSRPGTLIRDFGAVATNSTGLKTIVLGSDLVLTKGLYWGCVITNGTPTIRGSDAWMMSCIPHETAGNTWNDRWLWSSQTYGALPDPAPTLTNGEFSGNVPCIWMQRKA
jgi:hypothetical protein